MDEGKKGGEIVSVAAGRVDMGYGCGGGGENACGDISVSYLRICSSEEGSSHGGGRIFARRWRFRRSASQSGRGERWGGRREGVGPFVEILIRFFDCEGGGMVG